MELGVAVVVGVGPGLGFSIAKRFAQEGYTVAILARNLDRLMKLAEEIVESMATAQVFAIRVDCSDAQSIKEAFEAVHSLGVVEVLVYNLCTRTPWPSVKFTDIDPQSFQHSLTLPSMGAFFCCKEVLPGLVRRRRGTILFTGATASVRGELGSAGLACGKFALRGLAQCLAREYHPQGIHVAHIMIDGIVAAQKYGIFVFL